MKIVYFVFYEIFCCYGLIIVFGNFGFNELLFFKDFFEDFCYIFGLYEGVVVGMVDGFVLVSGCLVFVNLYVVVGIGNGMGVLINVWYFYSFLVIIVGQQVCLMIGVEVMFVNVDVG